MNEMNLKLVLKNKTKKNKQVDSTIAVASS